MERTTRRIFPCPQNSGGWSKASAPWRGSGGVSSFVPREKKGKVGRRGDSGGAREEDERGARVSHAMETA
jgi:hypothetical protein